MTSNQLSKAALVAAQATVPTGPTVAPASRPGNRLEARASSETGNTTTVTRPF